MNTVVLGSCWLLVARVVTCNALRGNQDLVCPPGPAISPQNRWDSHRLIVTKDPPVDSARAAIDRVLALSQDSGCIGWGISGTTFLMGAWLWNKFLLDDAFITFRYTRNVAEGYGLVWNPGGEPTEGFSSPLMVALMVPASRCLVRKVGVVVALTVLCVAAMRLAYFGYVSPNPFYHKVDAGTLAGLDTVQGWLWVLAAALAVPLLAWVVRPAVGTRRLNAAEVSTLAVVTFARLRERADLVHPPLRWGPYPDRILTPLESSPDE